MDGCPISSEAEQQRVILCLEAAIKRRASEVYRSRKANSYLSILRMLFCDFMFDVAKVLGLFVIQGIRLELRSEDRVGLLSDVTRIFRENGLSVTRAEVTTRGSQAVNAFYVTDASGKPVKSETIEAVRKEIGMTILCVNDDAYPKSPSQESGRFSFGNLFRSRSERVLYNLGLMKSYS